MYRTYWSIGVLQRSSKQAFSHARATENDTVSVTLLLQNAITPPSCRHGCTLNQKEVLK